jgi:hypothetical protein
MAKRALTAEAGQFHAVRFYQDSASLSQIVCGFIGEGLAHREPAVVIATAEHTKFFLADLARTIDVDGAIAGGELTLVDAEESLAGFMRDGMPDGALFTGSIGRIIRAVNERVPGAPVRAYGEMVDVLWRRSETVAAIRLEMLWNQLARSCRFGLLCGYSMGNFYKDAATEEICGQHSHVVSETGSRVALH